MNKNILRDNMKLPFVERENLIKAIEDHYREILFQPKNEKSSCLINIYGQGGMGKTYVAEHIKQSYPKFIYYDLELYRNQISDISDILVAIAASTRSFGFKFDLFVIAYEQYLIQRQKYNSASINIEKTNIPVGDIAAAFLDAVSVVNPGVAIAAKGGIAAGKVFNIPEKIKNLFGGKKRKVLDELEKCTNINQFEDFLVGYFIQEMNENLSKISEPMVIFLDTYEAYFGKSSYKKIKRESCVQTLAKSLNNVVWIVGGRNVLGWGFEKVFHVEKISKDESFETIFDGMKIVNTEDREYIKKETGGYPEYLHQLIREYIQMKNNRDFSVEELTGGLKDLIKRICHDLDDAEIELLRKLCIIGGWNEYGVILCDILYDFSASERQYRTLVDMGFVKNNHVDKTIREIIFKDVSVMDVKNLYRKYGERLQDTSYKEKDFYVNQRRQLLYVLIEKDKNHIQEYENDLMAILLKLFDIVEDNTAQFEQCFFELWDVLKDGEFNDIVSGTALVLYRKYLILIDDLESIKHTIKPEREARMLMTIKNNKRVFYESAITYMLSNTGLNDFVTEYYMPIMQERLNPEERDEVIQYVYAVMLNSYQHGDADQLNGVLQMYSIYRRDYMIEGIAEYFKMSLLALKAIVALHSIFDIEVEYIVDRHKLFSDAQACLGKNHHLTAEILQYCIAENCKFVSKNDLKEQYEFYYELYGENFITQKWKFWYADCLTQIDGKELDALSVFNEDGIIMLTELDIWAEKYSPKIDWHCSVLFTLYRFYFTTADDENAKRVKTRYKEICKGTRHEKIHMEQFFELESMLIAYRDWKMKNG